MCTHTQAQTRKLLTRPRSPTAKMHDVVTVQLMLRFCLVSAALAAQLIQNSKCFKR